MLARGDSLRTPGPSAGAPAAFPAWARAVNAPESEAEAAYLAGAALGRLDAIVRENPPWAGVWRRRLALGAAAMSVLRAGRSEDEARLRDAFHLTRPGADPGPAGRRLLAWRELSARSIGALAFVFSPRRRGLGGSARRGAAGGDRRRRGWGRGQATGAVRRGASLCPRMARPDARRPAPVLGRPGRGGRAAGSMGFEPWRAAANLTANSTSNSRTCRRRRAGANGWAGSRRRSSPPLSQCCGRTW